MKKHTGPGSYLAALLFVLALAAAVANAQQPAGSTPSPSPSTNTTEDNVGNYNVVSSLEVGVRGLSVSGSDNKYRSDKRPTFLH